MKTWTPANNTNIAKTFKAVLEREGKPVPDWINRMAQSTLPLAHIERHK